MRIASKNIALCLLIFGSVNSLYTQACTNQVVTICLHQHGVNNGFKACWEKSAGETSFYVPDVGSHVYAHVSTISITNGDSGETFKLCYSPNFVTCFDLSPSDYALATGGATHNDKLESFQYHCP